MTKVVLGMSMSLDGIAGGQSADAEGWALHEAILGWVFPLRSWREAAGQDGGEDSVDSRAWAEDFGRVGPQVLGVSRRSRARALCTCVMRSDNRACHLAG